MTRCAFAVLSVAVLALSTGARGAIPGFVDSFSSPGTSGWSGTGTSNPGSGGAGGSGGYLKLSSTFTSHFAAKSTNAAFQGDWIAAGIDQVEFDLNDVGVNQSFSFHMLISNGTFATTWQYDMGFDPPSGTWQRYVVDVTSSAGWTQIRGEDSFENVLRNVERIHFRHDLAPYMEFPDDKAGDIGIDNISLVNVPEPAIAGLLGMAAAMLLGRARGRAR